MTELELLLVGMLGALALINAIALYRQRSADGERKHGKSPSKDHVLAERTHIKRQLELERGTRVITLIHRKEPWSLPKEEPEIVLEDAESILDEIRRTPTGKPIDLIIHTPGGLAFASDLIAMAVKYHEGKVTAFVPFYAMSGGSLIALAADEIRMEKYSTLGPIDPQIEGYPAAAFISVLKRKPVESITDKTFILAEKAEMEIRNQKEFVKWLLRDKMDEPQAEQVAEVMVGGYMAHETMITMEPAKKMGLNVVEGVPERVYEMFGTYDFSIPKKITGHEYR